MARANKRIWKNCKTFTKHLLHYALLGRLSKPNESTTNLDVSLLHLDLLCRIRNLEL